jgi:hypothetical protein
LQDFRDSALTTDTQHTLPLKLEDIYISNIVTVVTRKFSEQVPLRFRKSKIWLGIEISGVAEASYSAPQAQQS